MKLMIKVLLINLCLFALPVHAAFDVHIIYYKPIGSEDIDVDKHDIMLKSIQKHFQSEMTKHNHENYTFPLELDDSNKVVVNLVNSKHHKNKFDPNQSTVNIYHSFIKPELPDRFHNEKNKESRDDVLLIFLGGVPAVKWGFSVGMGNSWFRGRWGGFAVVKLDASNKYPNHYLALITHELGHAFGLGPEHNDEQQALNGQEVAFGKTVQDWGNRMKLLKEEADLLKSRNIFREIKLNQVNPPKPLTKNPNVEEENTPGEDHEPIHVRITKSKIAVIWAQLKNRL